MAGARNTSSPRSACDAASSSSAPRQPSSPALPPGRKWSAPPAGRDLKPPVAPRAGGELHQPVAVLVQHPELQRAVALGRKLAGEHASVSEPDAAAQSRGRALARSRIAGGGGCGHLILPAQVWARRAPVPAPPVEATDASGSRGRSPRPAVGRPRARRACRRRASRPRRVSSTCQSPSAVSRTTSSCRAPVGVAVAPSGFSHRGPSFAVDLAGAASGRRPPRTAPRPRAARRPARRTARAAARRAR